VSRPEEKLVTANVRSVRQVGPSIESIMVQEVHFRFQLSGVEIVPFLGMMKKWFGLESFSEVGEDRSCPWCPVGGGEE
jgi:hypothetical protein